MRNPLPSGRKKNHSGRMTNPYDKPNAVFPEVARGGVSPGDRPEIPPEASLVSPSQPVPSHETPIPTVFRAVSRGASSLLGRLRREKETEGEKNEPGTGRSARAEKPCPTRARVPRWAPGGGGNLLRDSRRVGWPLHRGLSSARPPPHLGAAGPALSASEAPTAGDQAPPREDSTGSPRASPPRLDSVRS